MISRCLSALVVGLVALGGGAAAQEWIGSAGVGVSVRDESGQPISGAAVVLVPEFGAPGDAPPFVFTDSAGRVEVFNLAAGEWAIEIRAAGYMIFNGYLKLEVGQPPTIGFSSRQRTGTFWQPLEARFFEVGVDEPILVGVSEDVRKEEKKRQAQLRKLAKQDEAAARRAEKRRDRRASQGAEVAVLTPSEPEPQPEPEPVESAAAEPEDQPSPPAREPGAEPAPVAEAPPPRRAGLEPEVEPRTPAAPPVFPPIRQLEEPQVEPIEGTPIRVAEAPEPAPDIPPRSPPRDREPPPAAPEPGTPEPSTPEPPTPATPSRPEPTAPSVPPIGAHPVLFRGGACPECKPGEWSLVIEREASPATGGETGCGSERDDRVGELLATGFPGVESFAGPVADMWGNELPASVWNAATPSLASALRSQPGSCQDFVGVLPKDARFIGFRFEAEDESGRSDCFGIEACAVGQARWTNNPQIARSASVTLVHASFVNESTARARRGRMTLYFRPLRGWEAPDTSLTRSAPNRRR